MSESELHAQLVDRILRSLDSEGSDYLIFVDSRDRLRLGIPPAIEAVRPDIFARHRRTRHAVIGEAKTASDVETLHTELQLECYFRLLAEEGNGELRLAVPWKRLDRMIFIARRARRLARADHIQFSVAGWALPEAEFCQVRHG